MYGKKLKIFFLVMVLCLSMRQVAQSEEVTSAAYTDYPPFSADYLEGGGFAIVLATEAFRREGFAVKHSWMPWVRGATLVEKGIVDFTLPYFFTNKRTSIYEYSEPIYSIYIRAYGLQGSAENVTSIEGLEGKTICHPRGYANPIYLQNLFDTGRATLRRPMDMEQCLKLTLSKRVDYFLSSPEVWKGSLERLSISEDEFEELSFNVQVNRLYLVFGKSNPRVPKLVSAFNSGLKKMSADGSLRKLAEKYGIATQFVDPLN